MVLASHVIMCTYGFWLPNDPRGSWSDWVRSWELFRYGPATKVNTTRSVAGKKHDRSLRLEAKKALMYPPVVFSGVQARAVATGFRNFVDRSGIVILACSIMPDHVHLVIQRHTYEVEKIANFLKGDATRQLMEEGLHPLANFRKKNGRIPGCWAQKEWKVYLDSVEDIVRAIRYVDNNPVKEGLSKQLWSFVQPSPLAPR